MFLNLLRRRNPPLVQAAIDLHQTGLIPANTYVLDVDTMAYNARLIADEAARLGLDVFAMTKQFGRNPVAAGAISEAGISSFVCVDMGCARPLAAHGLTIGHLGHLVQVPVADAREAAGMRPRFWTIFNQRRAEMAAQVNHERGATQRLLARIHAPDDRFYNGHEGGFPAENVQDVAESLDALDGAEFGGITSFPAATFDPGRGTVELTPNMSTLSSAASRLRTAGWTNVQVNAPGTTSTAVLAKLANAGVTQVEPGHALTGSTPWHAVRDLPEVPACVYVSEVSHHHGSRSYFFGGGLYADPVFGTYPRRTDALVGREASTAQEVPAEIPDAAAIDYYGQLHDDGAVSVGDTVLLGQRAQAFVTRALVAPLTGLAQNHPRVAGLWTVDGRRAEWTPHPTTKTREHEP